MPNLTAKELSSLEDQLSAEQLLVKKYKSYAVLSSDPQLKTCLLYTSPSPRDS